MGTDGTGVDDFKKEPEQTKQVDGESDVTATTEMNNDNTSVRSFTQTERLAQTTISHPSLEYTTYIELDELQKRATIIFSDLSAALEKCRRTSIPNPDHRDERPQFPYQRRELEKNALTTEEYNSFRLVEGIHSVLPPEIYLLLGRLQTVPEMNDHDYARQYLGFLIAIHRKEILVVVEDDQLKIIPWGGEYGDETRPNCPALLRYHADKYALTAELKRQEMEKLGTSEKQQPILECFRIADERDPADWEIYISRVPELKL